MTNEDKIKLLDNFARSLASGLAAHPRFSFDAQKLKGIASLSYQLAGYLVEEREAYITAHKLDVDESQPQIASLPEEEVTNVVPATAAPAPTTTKKNKRKPGRPKKAAAAKTKKDHAFTVHGDVVNPMS